MFQIKITLLRTAPPIWRRLLVPSVITLSGLHDLLQLAMGWTGLDRLAPARVPIPLAMLWPGRSGARCGEGVDERNVRLNRLLASVGAKIVYAYDFGDGWEHGIVLEKCLPVAPNIACPLCTRGAGACPPEDCGGIGGFYSLLEVIRNPQQPRHKELLEWVGGNYDSEEFSIEAINRVLRGRKKRAARSSG